MAILVRRYSLFYNSMRSLHNGVSVPTFDINTERKAFVEVLPEVINSIVTGPKLTKLPEIGSWLKKLLDYTMDGGKLGRGLMVSIGYRMYEEPEHYSEETQHSARIIGWCLEMHKSKHSRAENSKKGYQFITHSSTYSNKNRQQFVGVIVRDASIRKTSRNSQTSLFNTAKNIEKYWNNPPCFLQLQTQFLIFDDILDGGTMRRGKPCWHLQPNVGLSGIKDALLIYHSILEVLDMYFGKTPIYADLLRQFNETVYIAIVGEHLDIWSSYNKEKNNFDVLTTDRIYKAIQEYKTAYYCYKLPLFIPLLLVKNGKSKATKVLHNICMEFGRLMQCQDDYLDAYGNEMITGKTGRDIQEGKCSWVAVTALQHCNDAQRAVFKEYYGSKDPEHVKRIKRLYDELQIPQLYEQCERAIYEDILRQIHVLPNKADRIFLSEVLNANFKRVC